MGYCPLDRYGIIGNMRTACLVSAEGSIDWLCMPRFDSPSVFAAILDDERGGRFSIRPRAEGARSEQIYWPDTNVLVTRHHTGAGTVEVVDFMPVDEAEQDGIAGQVVRVCRAIGGEVELRVRCEPACDYGRAETKGRRAEHGVVFEGGNQRLWLGGTADLDLGDGGVDTTVHLESGERAAFVLKDVTGSGASMGGVTLEQACELLERTRDFWRRWVSSCTYRGRWGEQVRRSALTLKLLTYEPTGAIVAAPTCSLPAPVGGVRNWDYRYTWIRDAAFTLYGLMRVGFTREVCGFMDWLIERCHELDPATMLQPLYGIDGRHEVEESTLDHFEGYMGSSPVRVGNAAHKQTQLDTIGALMDSVYLYNKHAEPVSYDLWRQLTRILDWVCEHWREQDHGVWEVRGPKQDFVYSKLMNWVALDRGVRLADKRSFPGPVGRWRAERDEIYNEIMTRGWSDAAGAFTQRYGSEALDAANMLMPLVFFVSPQDPRMLRTIDAVSRPLHEGGLMDDVRLFRYRMEETDDGLKGEEAGFNICTFWLIEALTRAGRTDPERLETARVLFEKMLACGSPLGLYAEQTGARGELVGNFPQAFTHLSFISAAFNLNRTLGG